MSTIDVVLIRHGESEWNKDNRFCGWVDVALSQKGIEEAYNAAKESNGMNIWIFSAGATFPSGIRFSKTLMLQLQ